MAGRPKDFVPPVLPVYSGKSDPVKHVQKYKQAMGFWLHDDATMCKQFASSLGDDGMEWFMKLPTGQIETFTDLAELFTVRFLSNRSRPKEMSALFQIHKKEGETLRKYFDRYWEWCADIRCSAEMKVSCFKDGLLIGEPLRRSLKKKPARDYSELSERLEKYILVEDDEDKIPRSTEANEKEKLKADEKMKEDPLDGKGKSPKEDNKNGKNGKDLSEDKDPKTVPLKEVRSEVVCTAFTMPIDKLMKEIQDESFFKWPMPLRGDPGRRNPKLKCAYHKDTGHTTDSCRTLQYHLNDLADQGHLTNYLKPRDRSGRESTRERKRKTGNEEEEDDRWESRKPRGIIHSIHGVVKRKSAEQRSQRAEVNSAALAERSIGFDPKNNTPTVTPYVEGKDQSEIVFSNADLAGLSQPHNDALVISLNIDTWDVHKVLIDPGSSTEIMYYNLYEQIQPIEVEEMSFPIYSFSGQAIFPIGTTTLTVRAGPVAKRVEFVIIGEESPYMAILGRTWLSAMRAVASPLHQKLKFPSKKGIVTVRGSQMEARRCFGHAIKATLTEVKPDEEYVLVVGKSKLKSEIVKRSGNGTSATKKTGRERHEEAQDQCSAVEKRSKQC